MLLMMADFWIGGYWLLPVATGSDVAVDIYGQAITMGATVKVIGQVSAIDLFNTHYQDITVIPAFPKGQVPLPSALNLRNSKTFSVHPKMLVVGGG